GVSCVVATPHVIPGTKWRPKPNEICDQVDRLNKCIKKENIPLTVEPGMEVALDTGILTLVDQNGLLPLGNSKYMLIEVPFQRLPLGWNQILFALQLKGFKILLAHPERCDHLIKKRAFFDDMIYTGAFLQVEWGSFLGHHGPEVKNQAEYLAQKGYIHCLATDSHNTRFRHAGHVEDAARMVELQVGRENLDLLGRKNPARVLKDIPLEAIAAFESPAVRKRKKRWQW
ncbi:MAG: tyrosine-protein phosphatase, partial [Desulfobacterales bacterium]